MTLLHVQDLCIRFQSRGKVTTAVDGISFALERGRTLGLVGESGSGKSVTCLGLLGLLPTSPACIVRGSAEFDGINLLNQPQAVLRSLRGNRISFIFQDPLTALNPYLTIGAQVQEPLQVHRGLSGRQARERALEALDEVGIRDPQRRFTDYPHEFSGGMRQRVMIAMALITGPDIVIADEPTTALDVTVRAQILDLLGQLQQQHGTAILFVSHDLGVIAGIADDVLVMRAGRCVETGTVPDIFASPRDAYTRQLLDSIPRGRKIRAPRDSPQPPAPLLRVEGLSVTYPGRFEWWRRRATPLPAVSDITLDIHPGEVLGLVGETGSGKSTLARAIVRLVEPGQGRVLLGPVTLTDLDPHALRAVRARVQMIFQDPYSSLNPRMTVHDCLAEALTTRRQFPDQVLREKIEVLLRDVGLDPALAGKYPHEFSGGQRQRIAIARALAPDPELLVADEPVSALDVTIQAQVLSLLLELNRRRGLSMLFVSHDLSVIRYIADRIAVLYQGRLVEVADTDTLFATPQHAYTRALLAAMPVADPAAGQQRRPGTRQAAATQHTPPEF